MLAEPDYDNFSYDELIDVYENIDRDIYPERFEKIKYCLKELVAQIPQVDSDSCRGKRKLKSTDVSVGVDFGWGFSFGGDGGSDGE